MVMVGRERNNRAGKKKGREVLDQGRRKKTKFQWPTLESTNGVVWLNEKRCRFYF